MKWKEKLRRDDSVLCRFRDNTWLLIAQYGCAPDVPNGANTTTQNIPAAQRGERGLSSRRVGLVLSVCVSMHASEGMMGGGGGEYS